VSDAPLGTAGGAGRPDLEARLDELERRIRVLEDERAVRQVLARFSFLEDTGRDEEWLALWTDDGRYDLSALVSRADGTAEEFGHVYVGRDELAAMVADPAGNRHPDFAGHALHTHSGTVDVEVEGDRATAHAYTVLHQEQGGRVWTASAAANRWSLRRVEGGWRVAERVRRQLATPGFAAILDAAGATSPGSAG
jgi:hypothetical protein